MMLFTTGWGAQSCHIIRPSLKKDKHNLCFFYLLLLQSLCIALHTWHGQEERGAWCATLHRVTKSQTQLKRLSTHAHMEEKSMEFEIWSTWISSFPMTSPPLSHCVGKSVNISSFLTWQRELIIPFPVWNSWAQCPMHSRTLINVSFPPSFSILPLIPVSHQKTRRRTAFRLQQWWVAVSACCSVLSYGVYLWSRLIGGSDSKESVCIAGDPGSTSGSGVSPGEGNLSTPVFLPGEFYGQRSLAGYSPWCC